MDARCDSIVCHDGVPGVVRSSIKLGPLRSEGSMGVMQMMDLLVADLDKERFQQMAKQSVEQHSLNGKRPEF